MKKIFNFSLLFFVAASSLLAQQKELAPCGTPPYQSAWLQEFQQSPAVANRSFSDTLYVAMTLHIVGRNNGSGRFALSQALSALCALNEDFKPAAIQFYLKSSLRYIDNSDFFEHNGFQGRQMMEQNNVPGTLNAYIVDDPNGACGYYNGIGITMAKSCMGANDKTFAHEVGHYLSLPHTFRGWESQDDFDYSQAAPSILNFYGSNIAVEKVDGSNCSNAGDGFCDTSPDYLSFRWNCNGDSESRVVQKDPNGEEFRSDGTLIMGYSDDRCATRFSNGQIAAMRANLQQERPSHLSNQPPPAPITSELFTPVFPAEGQMVPNNTAFTLEWEPIEGARMYFVEVTVLPSFGFVLQRYITNTNSVAVGAEDLVPNKTHYWRIRPFNFYDACNDFTAPMAFEVSDLVSSNSSAEPVESLRLFPNPAKENQEVVVEFSSNKAEAFQLSILATTGQALSRRRADAVVGVNRVQLPLDNLPKGLYLIRLDGRESSTYRRLLIQ